jgi:hypothetical protein
VATRQYEKCGLGDGGFSSFAMAAHCVFNGEVITTYQHTGTEKLAQSMDEVTGTYWGAAAVVSRDETKRRSVHAVLLYKTANGSDKDQITKTVRAFLLHAPTFNFKTPRRL